LCSGGGGGGVIVRVVIVLGLNVRKVVAWGVVVLESCLIVILLHFVSAVQNIDQFSGKALQQPVVVGVH